MGIYYGTTKLDGRVTGDTMPLGAMIPWTSDTIPDNWLLCNGQAVSRTTYSLLYAVIGTTYGAGDASTTFNVPDMRDYVPVGKSATDTNINALGEKYGAQTHTLTVTELPDITVNTKFASSAGGNGSGLVYGTTTGNSDNLLVDVTGNGGAAHNNMQKSIATNYIIKAQQSSGIVATVVDNLTSTSATNALSANQGKVLNASFVGVRGTVLWTNANPTSNFTGATVTVLDDTAYDYIEVKYDEFVPYLNYGSTGLISKPVTYGTNLQAVVYSGGVIIRTRLIKRESATSYTFGIASQNGTNDESKMVPLKIIGYTIGI